MNMITQTFADLTQALTKFTAVQLCADFFQWADETDNFPHIRWSLSALGVSFEPSMPVAELKARIERKLEQEISRGERRHWSFDANRLITWRQMLRAIAKFQEAV